MTSSALTPDETLAEFRAGRTLDGLQGAYRVGARVAWRRFAAASQTAGVHQETVARLAEAIFAYIDGLSADSVEGYAQAQAALAGERELRRTELVGMLLTQAPGSDPAAMARLVGWSLPRTAAALACGADRLAGLARRLGPAVLAAPFDGLGCVIVPGRAPSPFQHEHDASHTTTSSIAPLFGAFDQVSSPKFLAALPIAPWEFSLGVWMVVKGFKPSTQVPENVAAGHRNVETELVTVVA